MLCLLFLYPEQLFGTSKHRGYIEGLILFGIGLDTKHKRLDCIRRRGRVYTCLCLYYACAGIRLFRCSSPGSSLSPWHGGSAKQDGHSVIKAKNPIAFRCIRNQNAKDKLDMSIYIFAFASLKLFEKVMIFFFCKGNFFTSF